MEPSSLANVFPENLEEAMFQVIPYEDEIRDRVNCERLRKIVSKLEVGNEYHMKN
jgi:hypothetical protein